MVLLSSLISQSQEKELQETQTLRVGYLQEGNSSAVSPDGLDYGEGDCGIRVFITNFTTPHAYGLALL